MVSQILYNFLLVVLLIDSISLTFVFGHIWFYQSMNTLFIAFLNALYLFGALWNVLIVIFTWSINIHVYTRIPSRSVSKLHTALPLLAKCIHIYPPLPLSPSPFHISPFPKLSQLNMTDESSSSPHNCSFIIYMYNLTAKYSAIV